MREDSLPQIPRFRQITVYPPILSSDFKETRNNKYLLLLRKGIERELHHFLFINSDPHPHLDFVPLLHPAAFLNRPNLLLVLVRCALLNPLGLLSVFLDDCP